MQCCDLDKRRSGIVRFCNVYMSLQPQFYLRSCLNMTPQSYIFKAEFTTHLIFLGVFNIAPKNHKNHKKIRFWIVLFSTFFLRTWDANSGWWRDDLDSPFANMHYPRSEGSLESIPPVEIHDRIIDCKVHWREDPGRGSGDMLVIVS